MENIQAITEAAVQPGIRWGGEAIRCPPERVPEGVELPYCPKHQWIMPDPACEACLEIRFQPLPHPPVLFYNSLQVDSVLHVPGWTQPVAEVFVGAENLCGLVVSPATDRPDAEGNMPVPFPFRVHAMCHDNENNNWLWGARMWSFANVEKTSYLCVLAAGANRACLLCNARVLSRAGGSLSTASTRRTKCWKEWRWNGSMRSPLLACATSNA